MSNRIAIIVGAGGIAGSLHVSRGTLEMNIEGVIPNLDATILCYCNAFNRGALSADTLRSMGYKNVKFIAELPSVFRPPTHRHYAANFCSC